MIRTRTYTGLSFGYLSCSRHPPAPEMTVILRGKFKLEPGRPLELIRKPLSDVDAAEPEGHDGDEPLAPSAPEERRMRAIAEYMLGQGPLSADRFADGDMDRAGMLLYPSDFAEFKLGGEAMVRADCHPPGGKAPQCLVEFHVGAWHKPLLVSGPRVWVDKFLGGKHTDPLPFEHMPLDYANAYGGPDFEQNPAGKGHEATALPNVEDPAHPIHRAKQHPTPAGYGPVSPEWPLRAHKRGTNYGHAWEQTRYPYYADDYDWSHQHAAPPDQQFDHYFTGNETLRFVNMHPSCHDFSVDLPGLRPRAFVMKNDGSMVEVHLVLDTLFADLPEGVLYLTWRGVTATAQDDLSDVSFLLLATETQAEPAKSADHYFELLRQFSEDPTGFNDSPAAALVQFEKDLESGELDRQIDALPEGEDAVSFVVSAMAKGAVPAEHLGPMLDTLKQAVAVGTEQGPEAAKEVARRVKKALRNASDGASPAPLPSLKPDGSIGMAAVLGSVLRVASDGQKEMAQSGISLKEYNDKVTQAIADADVAELKQSTLPLALGEGHGPLPDPAPGADYSGRDLSELDLCGADLTGANFEGAVLTRTVLRCAKLAGANFFGASMARADLSGADCTGADFSFAHLSKTRAIETTFADAKLDNVNLMKADLTGANLSRVSAFSARGFTATLADIIAVDANFEHCIFDGCDLTRADLSRCNARRTLFRNCTMHHIRLDRADVSNAAFLESDLSHGSFVGLHGDTTNWHQATLNDADFSHAKLPRNHFTIVLARQARFTAADMPEVRFYRAALREADFAQANLFTADLRKAAITDTSFRGANLYLGQFIEAYGTDADFHHANLAMANFKRARVVKKL